MVVVAVVVAAAMAGATVTAIEAVAARERRRLDFEREGGEKGSAAKSQEG